MSVAENKEIVFQRNADKSYLLVSGFPGSLSYYAGILSRGIIAGEDVFVYKFQTHAGVQPVVVSEEELINPNLFTEIGMPGARGVPGIYPFHLY